MKFAIFYTQLKYAQKQNVKVDFKKKIEKS